MMVNKSLRRISIFLVRISHQTSHDIDSKVCQGAVSTMFKIENIFELVIDSFNDAAFSQN